MYHRQPESNDALIQHTDRGSQYLSVWYNKRLAEAGIEPSVGNKADSSDNGLAEPMDGLYKTKLNAEHLGRPMNHWSWQCSNGCPGLTTTDCLSPSDIFPLPKLKKITIGN